MGSRGSIQHFARIEKVERVEGSLEAAHEVQAVVPRLKFEPWFLGEPDAVFAGDGAAASQGFVDDFVERFVHTFHFLVVFFVREKRGMQVAVAHVSKGADEQVVALGCVRDKANHGSEFRAWDGDVLEDGGGANASECGESVASCGCERDGFRIVLSGPKRNGAVGAGDLLHGGCFILNSSGMSVGFHEKNGFAIERETDACEFFDTTDCVAIEELECAWDDTGRDNSGDGFCGVFHAGK